MSAITQNQLEQFVKLFDQSKRLDAKLKMIEKDIRSRFDAGSVVESGPLAVGYDSSERKYVNWRLEFSKRIGEDIAKAVLENAMMKNYRKFKIYQRIENIEPEVLVAQAI